MAAAAAAAAFGSSQFLGIQCASPPSAQSPCLPLHQDLCRSSHLNATTRQSFSSARASSSGAEADSVVTLLDYGAGNVRSVRNAIRFLGFDIKDVETPEDIINADRLIFPGVGAFAPMMDVLNKNGMAEALRVYLDHDRPFLGICLGLQLLFDYSEENGQVGGLGLIPGVVGRFDSSRGLAVPHIGWNALQLSGESEILDDVGSSHVYFVHSYRAVPTNENKRCWSFHFEEVFVSQIFTTKKRTKGKASRLAKRVIACLDVRANDKGDLVVTKGDQYDVREHTEENEVRNLGKPVELAGQYYKDGADELSEYHRVPRFSSR